MNFKDFQTDQKLRGGYYTSEDLADFLTRWAAGTNPESILEPSCGDGVFFNRVASHMGNPTVTAFEIDIEEAEKAREQATSSARMVRTSRTRRQTFREANSRCLRVNQEL